jgi:hypothetical protein
MKENGTKTSERASESRGTPRATFLKESGSETECMAKASSFMQMGLLMRVFGSMDRKSKDMVSLNMLTAMSRLGQIII